MIIYAADHPLVLNGTYDREGYKPGERARIAQARARQERIEAMAKTKKRTGGAKAAAAKTRTRARPRQQDLPGTEDRAIKPLEDVAASYAEVRDERIALNKREHELKELALKLMKKYDKTIYRHDGIEIRVVPGEDDVKVRIKKPGEDDGDATDSGEDVEIEADGAASDDGDEAQV